MTLTYKNMPGYTSETIKCKKLILGTFLRGCSCATSWCDLDLTLNLVIVNMKFTILSGLFLGFHTRCRRLTLSRNIGEGV